MGGIFRTKDVCEISCDPWLPYFHRVHRDLSNHSFSVCGR
jgi:hypothetical protein